MPKLAEQIAVVVGGGVTAGIEVTEEEIMLPPHYPKALRELEKRAPGITTMAEGDERRFDADLAIVYQTALLMLDAVKDKVVKRDQTPSETVERFEVDWEATRARLLGERDKALGDLLPEDAVPSGVGGIGFAVTHPPVYPPRRGW